MEEKYRALKEYLTSLESVLVAFSGGVDSTLLTCAAREVLGERAAAVTAISPLHPAKDIEAATALAARIGVRHLTVISDEMEDPAFLRNPPERCYICKKKLFAKLIQTAADEGLHHVAEGSNQDDCTDYRPGMRAIRELGVLSPLMEVGLKKDDIRRLAKQRNLPNWDRPSQACLASRIPFGEKISEDRLHKIQQAEEAIFSLGFKQLRVRDHGLSARIEVSEVELNRFLEPDMRQAVVSALKKAGYSYISLDLEGYRTGSLNPSRSEKARCL